MSSQTFCPTSPDGGYRLVEDMEDYEINVGHRFSAFWRSTIAGTVGTNILAITANDLKDTYAWFSVETDKAGMYELYEGAVISGGTVITAFNNNRDSTIIADATVVGNPTVATVGTFIGSHVIGSVTGGASKSGGTSHVNKYKLRKNTAYLLKFIADDATTRVTQSAFWREF